MAKLYRMKAYINREPFIYQGTEAELRRVANAILRQYPQAVIKPLIRVGILGRKEQ